MTKFVSPLILAAVAAFAFNAQAGSHAGGAPMAKASAPAAKASEAKKDMKSDAKKDAKKEEKK